MNTCILRYISISAYLYTYVYFHWYVKCIYIMIYRHIYIYMYALRTHNSEQMKEHIVMADVGLKWQVVSSLWILDLETGPSEFALESRHILSRMWQKIFQLLRKKWKRKLQLNLKMVPLPSKLKCKRTLFLFSCELECNTVNFSGQLLSADTPED